MARDKIAQLTAGGFGLRLVFALALVLLTYNPTEYSYIDWVREGMTTSTLGPVHLVPGLALLIGWTIYVRASMRSLGTLGLLLAAALIGAIVWLLTDLGWLQADTAPAIAWISLVSLAVLLAVGISWSHIRRRLSGQYDTDEIE